MQDQEIIKGFCNGNTVHIFLRWTNSNSLKTTTYFIQELELNGQYANAPSECSCFQKELIIKKSRGLSHKSLSGHVQPSKTASMWL
jgi:hypothetical protein